MKLMAFAFTPLVASLNDDHSTSMLLQSATQFYLMHRAMFRRKYFKSRNLVT